MSVYRNNGIIASGAAEPETATMNFPAVTDLTNSSLFWNNDCGGTGTAFPRTMIAVRLTAVNTLEYWRSDTGQPNDCRYEVVQWPQTPSFSIQGTVYTDEAKTTPVGAGETVALSVNGGTASTTPTDGSGQFSFGTTVNPNDVILTYLDDAISYTWAAYHALYATASGTNITTGAGTGDLPATNLIKNSDGTDTGTDIAITWLQGNTNRANNGDKDPTGGDAFDIFNGKIALDNNYCRYRGTAGTDFLTVTFSNLDTDKKYTVALYNSDNNSEQSAPSFRSQESPAPPRQAARESMSLMIQL